MKKLCVAICLVLCLFQVTACQSTEPENTASYQINAALCDDMTLSYNMTYEFVKPSDDSENETRFLLYPNAFRQGAKIKPLYASYYEKAYPNGASYGSILVKKTLVNGKVAEFEITGEDDNVLAVKSECYQKGKQNVIYMECLVKIPNVLHRFGYGDNTINLTSFYPVAVTKYKGDYYENVYYPSGDPFYSVCADYDVNLTVPSEYVVASSLSPTKTEVYGFKTKYSYSREGVRDIAFILSKNFKVLKSQSKNASVYYYYFNDMSPEKSIDTAVKSLDFYSDNFCEYPYEEYVVCEADFIYGGMEYPCLTFIDKNLENEDRDYCIAHETAHQWWYGIVGVNQSEDGYIDEGLTEYSTVRFFDEAKGDELNKIKAIENVKNTYAQIRKIVAEKGGDAVPKMNRNLKDFSSDMDYVSVAYYRSQIMFFELEEYLGKRNFNRFLDKIIKNYSYKNLNTEDLLDVAKSVKSSSKKFLQDYINGVTPIN